MNMEPNKPEELTEKELEGVAGGWGKPGGSDGGFS